MITTTVANIMISTCNYSSKGSGKNDIALALYQ